MANTFNTGVYPQEWLTKLQQRLDKPTNWKEVCDVVYSDTQVFNWPYMSTEFVIQTGTRGTAYGFSDFALTNDALTINTYKPVPAFIDRADMAQCKLVNQMEIADRQGRVISEWLESAVLATHASWTNFGDTGGGVLGLGASQITVSLSNIDDIIRGVKREIITANGLDQMNSKGVFFVWRPADFEKLEAFLQANGYNLADQTLKEGIMTEKGYYALGAYHYVSNSHTANHVFAGVRKIMRLGILRSTWGQIVITQDPLNTSGVGIVSRVDYGTQIPAGLATMLYDVNVA